MRMLERSLRVQTRFGGGFVQSIDGHAGTSSRLDWFYYVNGIEASEGAATTPVHRGDRIWWDLHDWTSTDTIPAVVGSYPEPFVHGVGGKRYPTTLECGSDVTTACKQAGKALNAIGVPVASQLLGTGSGQATLTVIVGTWADVKNVIAANLIAHGPKSSGVYATFGPGGADAAVARPGGPRREDARRRRRPHRRHRRPQLDSHLADHRHGSARGGRGGGGRLARPAARPFRAGRTGVARLPGSAPGGIVNYRRRPSPLHAARAAAGAMYCLALACAALITSNPLVLGCGDGLRGLRGTVRRRRTRDPPRRAAGDPDGDRHRADQRARDPRRADRYRAPRTAARTGAHRHHARGDRLRRRPRAARRGADPVLRPCTPPRSIPTRCCACSAGSRFARR